MRNRKLRSGSLAACLLAFALMAMPGLVAAAEKGHGSMPGMKGHGAGDDHGTMKKMGDRIHSGTIGPWNTEVRLVDMKAQMEAAGMKMDEAMMAMMKTHHVSLHLIDPKTGKPVAAEQGSGTVTVAGPGVPEETTPFMVMEGHFGADVNLPKPGTYTFKAEVETGGRTGAATFTHKVH
jgi:hypothetical protein